jgi:putative Mg2+ transporter-C (MgtC) family protein
MLGTMVLPLDAELALRVLVAAILGGLIGLERELHEHPAGIRTHLLVALGCALFTVISIYGFDVGPGPRDPARLAAQIVTGIGFLGAGAILKYGTSIRGLTTAASLWATSAVGVTIGTGWYLLGLVGATLILFSLWPLHLLSRRLRLRNAQSVRLRLGLQRLELLGELSRRLTELGAQVEGVQTHHRGDRIEVELDLRLDSGAHPEIVIATVSEVPGVDVLEADRALE